MGWDKLPVAIGQHLLFTLVSVAIGFALGLVLGILLSRRPKLSGVVLPVLSVFNTIPGIVFIGLLVLAWGAGTATVLVALGIYATFPVLKNTYAGLVSVDQQYIEAARGCGMSAIQSLIRVELPEDITTARTWLTRNVNADFSRTPGVSKPSPALGNGNREILGGIGMTEEEIGRLQSKWLEAKR